MTKIITNNKANRMAKLKLTCEIFSPDNATFHREGLNIILVTDNPEKAQKLDITIPLEFPISGLSSVYFSKEPTEDYINNVLDTFKIHLEDLGVNLQEFFLNSLNLSWEEFEDTDKDLMRIEYTYNNGVDNFLTVFLGFIPKLPKNFDFILLHIIIQQLMQAVIPLLCEIEQNFDLGDSNESK